MHGNISIRQETIAVNNTGFGQSRDCLAETPEVGSSKHSCSAPLGQPGGMFKVGDTAGDGSNTVCCLTVNLVQKREMCSVQVNTLSLLQHVWLISPIFIPS